MTGAVRARRGPRAVGAGLFRGVVAAAVLSSCEPAAQREGTSCLFNGDCRAPLVCAGRACRVACRTPRDCVLGQACRPSGEGLMVCIPEREEPLCGPELACAAPLVCAIDFHCRPECLADYDCRLALQGGVCSPTGQCIPGDAGAPRDAATDVVRSDATPADAPDAASLDAASDVALDTPRADSAAVDPDAAPFFTDGALSFDVTPGADLLMHFSAIGGGTRHRCGIAASGGIYCWGSNGNGELGTGAASPASTYTTHPVAATAFPAGHAWVAVESSSVANGGHAEDTTCALALDGAVFCVGAGTTAQLGNGASVDSLTAVQVAGITDARQISLAEGHACAVTAAGTVLCWGNGVLGNAAATATAASPVGVTGLADAAEVVVAPTHACARRRGGAVVCWGRNYYDDLGSGDGVEAVEPVPVVGITTAVQLSASGETTCALLADGGARCWGVNSDGQLGSGMSMGLGFEPATPTPVTVLGAMAAIAAGQRTTCAITGPERRVMCWGNREAVGDRGSPVGDALTPVAVLGLRDVQQLTAGPSDMYTGQNFCARRGDGAAWCWGWNYTGALGNGRADGGGSYPVLVSR